MCRGVQDIGVWDDIKGAASREVVIGYRVGILIGGKVDMYRISLGIG